MKVCDLFYINQGRQITDEEIYFSHGDIPILTANNEIKGYGNSSIVSIDMLPCLTYPTKAFSGNIYVQYNLFDANNTAVLTPKDEYKNELNLSYLAITLTDIFSKNLSSESQVSYLGKNILSELEIEYPFPPLDEQKAVVEKYEKIINLNRIISLKLSEIEELIIPELKLSKNIILKMSKIALMNKGSNKISEKMIYENYDQFGIPVYSSATENDGLMGKISVDCYNSFHKKGKANELTWTTNGYAGKVFYRDTDYLYSEKCGRIVIREQYKDKIMPQYLCIVLNQITHKYKTAESNNGKLDIIHMEKIPVPIPIDSDGNIDVEQQKNIIKLYNRINTMINKLEEIKLKLI